MYNYTPLVSIIVPIYKVEQYLEKCFDSIDYQTYKNIEVILVDDGSPDKCGDMCEEYARKHNNVKVIHKQNGGLSSARNAGLEVATGELVYFFDSDDYISDNLVERCVDLFRESSCDLVVFNYKNFDDNGNEWKQNKFSRNIFNVKSEKSRLHLLLNEFLKYEFGYEAWNRMYKRSAIIDNGLRFAPNKEVFSEDICFNLCYLLVSNHIEVIEDDLYFYRIRRDSIMGQHKSEVMLDKFINLSKYVENEAKRLNQRIIIEHFNLITMLVVDVRLMNIKLNARKDCMVNDTFLMEKLKTTSRHLINNIYWLGTLRGVKNTILARYYLYFHKIDYMLLSRFLK